MAISLTGCQAAKPLPAIPASGGKSAALLSMERVAIAANRCWFASKDPAFRAYAFANELNSFSGRPRFLLVPKGNYGGKPLLVVQSEGPGGKVETFGPLLDGDDAARIRGDIARWSSGNAACNAAA